MLDNDDVFSQWQETCRSAQSLADLIAASCRRKAAALVQREADKFKRQEPPKTKAELRRREKQREYLTSRIADILHADHMGRIHRDVSNQILAETRAFLDGLGLDESPDKGSQALISKITDLCAWGVVQKA